jgi:uncharacterized DUF497 family protein
MPEFEWDDNKAAQNLRKHGVSFPFATAAFRDPLAVERIDDRFDYGDERIIRIGRANTDDHEVLLTVVYTEHDELYRLISARPATRHEQDEYYYENAL